MEVTLPAAPPVGLTLALGDDGCVVVDAVASGSNAARHVRPGDVLSEINGTPVGSSAVAAQAQLAYIADVLRLQVHRCPAASFDGSAALRLLHSFGDYGLSPGQFSLPCCTCSLPDGDLVVSDGGGCRLQVVGPTGKLGRVIGCRGDQPGQFNYPAGLATDGEAVFVADRGNCRVQKLRLSDGGHVASTVLEEENAVCVGKSGRDGRPPVAVPAASPRGAQPPPDAFGGGVLLSYPWGIALSDGCLFASDRRGRLRLFDSGTLDLLGSEDFGAADAAGLKPRARVTVARPPCHNPPCDRR